MITVVMARDQLAGGTVLSASDLRADPVVAADVPEGVVTDPDELLGKTLAAPVARNQMLTLLATTSLVFGFAQNVVLLDAAMRGDSTRFTRQDGVEETWRVFQPLLDAPPPVRPYAQGSWGPSEANRLVEGFGRWHEPWMSQ